MLYASNVWLLLLQHAILVWVEGGRCADIQHLLLQATYDTHPVNASRPSSRRSHQETLTESNDNAFNTRTQKNPYELLADLPEALEAVTLAVTPSNFEAAVTSDPTFAEVTASSEYANITDTSAGATQPSMANLQQGSEAPVITMAQVQPTQSLALMSLPSLAMTGVLLTQLEQDVKASEPSANPDLCQAGGIARATAFETSNAR